MDVPASSNVSETIMEKFGHLLKPLRNLADDWEIDVAHDLEGYLEELSHLQITIDGQNCNFAEAALLIQGSTFHYSRKVESLLKLVYAALNAISTNKRRINLSKSKQNPFDAADGEIHFLELDWPTAAPNIDLKESKLALRRMSSMSSRNSRRSSIAGIDQNMSIASVDSMASVRTNATGGSRRRQSILNLLSHSSAKNNDPNSNQGGDNVQFRLSSCGMDKSGALLLDKSACFNRNEPVDLSMSRLSRTGVGLAGASHVDAADIADGHHDDADMSDFGGMDDDYPDDGHVDFPANDGANPVMQSPGAHQRHQPELGIAHQLAQDLIAAADPLAPLDPHVDDGNTKEFRKGKPFVVPRSLRASRRRNSRPADKAEIVAQWLASVTERTSFTARATQAGRRPFAPVLEEDGEDENDGSDDEVSAGGANNNGSSFNPSMTFPAVQAVMPGANARSNSKHSSSSSGIAMKMPTRTMPICEEFRPIVRQQIREQNRQKKLQEMSARFSSAYGMARNSSASFNAATDLMQAQLHAGFSDYDDDDDMMDDGNDDFGDDGDFGANAAAAADDDNMEFDFQGAATGDGASSAAGAFGRVDAQQIVDGVDFGDEAGSYEGLVKEIEERWYKAGKEYERTSRLAERVSAWEDKLRPIFEEQATHPPFDIDRYGDNILSTYVENLDSEEEVVTLATLAQNKPRYDVCRIFLASLQLANTGNIDIEGPNGTAAAGDGEHVQVFNLEQLHFRLKTTTKTNFMEYRAPSAAVAAGEKPKRLFGKSIPPNVANAIN